jgi:hypothetical protein
MLFFPFCPSPPRYSGSAERKKTPKTQRSLRLCGELLRKLYSTICSKDRGSKVSKENEALLRKFAQQVDKIFKNLPKSLEWQSFYIHDLPLLMDISKEVQKISIQNGLNRSQTRALEMLKTASEEEFQRVTACGQGSPNSVIEPDNRDSSQIDLKDLSAREIKGIAEKVGVVQQTVNNWISDIRAQQREGTQRSSA